MRTHDAPSITAAPPSPSEATTAACMCGMALLEMLMALPPPRAREGVRTLILPAAEGSPTAVLPLTMSTPRLEAVTVSATLASNTVRMR